MNLSSLDTTLRSLTSSEQKYLSGFYTDPFSLMPVIEKDGQIIHQMIFQDGSHLNAHNGALFLKKQSRYLACPMHVHNWVEINYMYSGQCPQTINNTSYVLEQGQVALIDTETPHSTAKLNDNDIMLSLVIHKDYLNSNFFNRLSTDSILSEFFINAINENTNHNNYILFHSEKSQKLQLFFHELFCEFYDPSINSTDMINSLVTLVLCELINVYENDVERQRLDMNKSTIGPILRYIESNYHTCTLESTAKFFNMNPNYLTTLLKQRTGNSYKELIQQQRLTRAAQFLRNTSLSITEISNKVGYGNVNFFYKKFKEHFNCLPKEYRQKNKKSYK